MQNKYPATLEGTMNWAFEGHDKYPFDHLNLDDLLAHVKKDGPVKAVDWLETRLEGNFSSNDKQSIIEALSNTTRKNPNKRIHSDQVLQFMADLFHHRSKIPPPWVT